jgi:DNA-binding MarR family transcriptional regulator
MSRTTSGSQDVALARGANLLGALSLALVDRMTDAIEAATDQSESASAALSALHFFIERPTVDTLRQVLGLTSSGAVRMVDRLVALGLVRRRPGDDGRTTFVVLTAAGRRAAEQVTRARTEQLTSALSPLSDTERATLEPLLRRVLVGMIRPPGAVKWTCRLCDTEACGRAQGLCPVANAAQAKYA